MRKAVAIAVAACVGAFVAAAGQAQPAPDDRAPATPVQIVEGPGGFDWGDAGIGAAFAIALMLVVVGAALVARSGRLRTGRAWMPALCALLGASGAVAAMAAPRAVPAGPYLGAWTARLTEAQLSQKGFDYRLAGAFQLVLNRNGTYSTFNALDGKSSGTFTVSGLRIVFRNDVLCKQGGFKQNGTYTWSVKAGKLKLVVFNFSDPCGGRWQTLTYPVWARG